MSKEAKKNGSPEDEPTSSSKAKELKLLVNRQEESSVVPKMSKARQKFLEFVNLGRFASSLYTINGILFGLYRQSISRKGLDALGGLSLKAESSWVKMAMDIGTLMPSKGGAAATFLEMQRSAELVTQFKDLFSQEIKSIKKEKKSDKASLLKRFVQYYKLYSKKQKFLQECIEELQTLLEEEYRQADYLEDEVSLTEFLNQLVARQDIASVKRYLQGPLLVRPKALKTGKALASAQKRTRAPALQPSLAAAPCGGGGSSIPPLIIDEPEISLHGQQVVASIANKFRRVYLPVAINIFNVNVGSDSQPDKNGRITIPEGLIAQLQNAFISATGKLLSNAPQMPGLGISNQVNAYLYSNMVPYGKAQSLPMVDVSPKSRKAIAREVASQTAAKLKSESLVRPTRKFFADPKKMTDKQKQQHDIQVIWGIQRLDANSTTSSTFGIEEAARRAKNAGLLIWYKTAHSASVSYRKLKNSNLPDKWDEIAGCSPKDVAEIKARLDKYESGN